MQELEQLPFEIAARAPGSVWTRCKGWLVWIAVIVVAVAGGVGILCGVLFC